MKVAKLSVENEKLKSKFISIQLIFRLKDYETTGGVSDKSSIQIISENKKLNDELI